MPIVKFDVSGSDPKAAFAGGGKQPTPGVYTVKLKEVKPGFRKGENGQPDKAAPRLEVVAEIQDKKFKGSLLYDYISFSEASQWKMDQFLQVLGLASTSKRKGSFDTTKVANKKLKVRVVGDTYNGEYRGKLGSYLPDDEAEDGEADEPDEDEEADEEQDEEQDLDSLGEQADADNETAIDILTGMAEEAGLDPDDYGTWAELATALGEAEGEEEPEDEDEPEEDESEDEDESDEEESDEEDEVPPYSEWSLPDLKAEIENRGLDATGKKSALVAALEADDEEDPF